MSKKLTRNLSDRMIAGVSSGLADYFQLEVTWVRIAFVLTAFFGGGGLWIYIILWIAVPDNNNSTILNQSNLSSDSFKSNRSLNKENINGNLIGGLILIAMGSYFLLDEFDIIPDWFNIGKLWPLIFVFIGVSILSKGARKEVENKAFNTNDFRPADYEKQTQNSSEADVINQNTEIIISDHKKENDER